MNGPKDAANAALSAARRQNGRCRAHPAFLASEHSVEVVGYAESGVHDGAGDTTSA